MNIRIFLFNEGASANINEREFKGKSLLLGLKDFVAIDLETTGLMPQFDAIIELGAVKYRAGIPIDRFESLVNPGFEIPEYVSELTGITDEMLSDAPILDAVLPKYLGFIGEDVVVGHNVNFDINFLYDACVNANIAPFSNDFVDTMRISRRLHKEWKNHKLDTLIKELKLEERKLHRSCEDANIAAQAYMLFQEESGFEEAIKLGKKNYRQKLKASDIVADESLIDEDSPIFGKVCVFTGTLEACTRKEAMQIVANIGGICGDSVNKKTNYLVLGNNDYCSTIKDGKSNKQKKAEKLILEGADLQIIPETVFWDMLRE